MVDLASCYFCGSVEGLKEYPVIPQDLYPPDDAQRTVVLCPACREKLGTILEPVFDYLDAPKESGSHGRSGDRPGTAAHGSTDQPAAANGSDGGPGLDARSPADDAEPDATAEPRSGIAESAEDIGADDGDRVAKVESDERGNQQTGSRDADRQGEAETERDVGDGAGGTLPEEAKQVARLLQNREFPVERAAVEELAMGAYELDRAQSREAIDALVDQGYLSEAEGMLHRP